MEQVRITDVGEFIASIPTITRYEPHDQHVLVVLNSDGLVKFAAATTPGDEFPEEQLLWSMQTFLAQSDPDDAYQALLVTYGDIPYPAYQEWPIEIVRWFGVGEDCWWNMEEGVEHDLFVGTPQATALAALLGESVDYMSREDLAASVAAVRDHLSEAQVEAVEDFAGSLPEDLESRAAVFSYVTAIPAVRDTVYTSLLETEDLAATVDDLTSMCREVPDAAGSTLIPLAAFGWLLMGNGTMASVLLERVPESKRVGNSPFETAHLALASGAGPVILREFLTQALGHDEDGDVHPLFGSR